jgi:hypothetical protein
MYGLKMILIDVEHSNFAAEVNYAIFNLCFDVSYKNEATL